VAARPHGERAGQGRQARGLLGHVEDSGEGRWTIEAAIEEAVPADVLAASLFVRFRSRQQHTFAEKVCRRCGSASAATSKRRRK
jgi:6-phosphogluconate dehydrogenase (decarboxylating)